MFRDARVADRELTASSFEQAHRRYAHEAESWFDGTIGSVDRRLAACDRLLHSVRFTVARLDIADSHRYLQAAEELGADRDALTDLRVALLTGAADRGDVVGPPGWRTANINEPPGWGQVNPIDNAASAVGSWAQAHGLDPQDLTDEDFERFADDSTVWLPPEDRQILLDHIRTKGFNIPPKGRNPMLEDEQEPPGWDQSIGRQGNLIGSDCRWVTLEAAKFVAANTDTLDDSHELATRADHYAAVKTSTFTPKRSALLREAFVAQVTHLGAQSYRPPLRTASAVNIDFEDSAVFL